MILTPLEKLTNNVSNLGKIIVATGYECLPKVQKIAQSGHTATKQAAADNCFEDVQKQTLTNFHFSTWTSWVVVGAGGATYKLTGMLLNKKLDRTRYFPIVFISKNDISYLVVLARSPCYQLYVFLTCSNARKVTIPLLITITL